MERHALYIVGGVIAATLAATPMGTSAVAALRECTVTVTNPQEGDKAGADVMVSGKATVPPTGVLHVFARRRGLPVFWPQTSTGAEIRNGEYHVLTTLGEPRDVGREFEIVVQVVDANENARIEAWFRRAEQTGRYPGISLPPFLAGCGAPSKVFVTKTE